MNSARTPPQPQRLASTGNKASPESTSKTSGDGQGESVSPTSVRFVTDARVSVTPDFDTLPEYAANLLSYHRSNAEALSKMVDALPVQPGQRWLDLATGDGTYAMLLAKRGVEVVALDSDPGYLAFASKRAERRGLDVRFCEGDAYRLPFADAELDGAFCAQSFYDLEDIPRVLSEMRRVVRPSGHLAVMENDSLHHLILPWPADLELTLRTAQLAALSATHGDESRFYVGRQLVPLLETQGLADVREQSFTTTLRAPLSADERGFLQYQLTQLLQLAEPHLSDGDRALARSYCTPGESEFLLDQPAFSATILDFLAWGRVSATDTGA